MGKIGVFYGSTTGDTEKVVKSLSSKFNGYEVDTYNITAANADDVKRYDNLIFAASTWGLGNLQDDWESFIDVIKSIDFNKKKVALLGTGDQSMYPDTFVDAIGKIYHVVKNNDAQVVGKVSTENYDFVDSEALIDDQFVGLAIDNTNQSNLTEERINNWAKNLFK